MKIITVIDAMMGSGKTQAMYQMIRSHPEKSYIIVTPYLNSISDAMDAGLDIRQPEYKGGTKLDSLKYLLAHGYNICCTHALFLNIDHEVLDLIRDSGYTLFIDEALDVVKPINDLIEDVGYKVKKGTASFLISQGIIAVDDLCRVRWCGKSMEAVDYEYRYLEPLIKGGNVLCVNGQLFLWMFPPQIFSTFENVYILSYLFDGSVFDGYLKIHGFNYSMGGVSGEYGGNEFAFTDYQDDFTKRKELKPYIKIYNGKANEVGAKKFDLSATWYDTAKTSDLAMVRRGFNTFYKRVTAPDRKLMWTAYKDQREVLCIPGGGSVRRLTTEESRAMEADSENRNPELNKLRCFVACNAKATNDYKDRNMLAYLINRFYNPLIKGMFRDKYGITLNEDRYALSEMIQWIWRSKIRANELPLEERSIDLYIPSARMRELMQKWLDGEAI